MEGWIGGREKEVITNRNKLRSCLREFVCSLRVQGWSADIHRRPVYTCPNSSDVDRWRHVILLISQLSSHQRCGSGWGGGAQFTWLENAPQDNPTDNLINWNTEAKVEGTNRQLTLSKMRVLPAHRQRFQTVNYYYTGIEVRIFVNRNY